MFAMLTDGKHTATLLSDKRMTMCLPTHRIAAGQYVGLRTLAYKWFWKTRR